MVGKAVGRYGGAEDVALDVRFGDGQRRLLRPGELEEVPVPRVSWRSLLVNWQRSPTLTQKLFDRASHSTSLSEPGTGGYSPDPRRTSARGAR